MKVLGVIPARGGSKGVPLKNIKHLAGKPLLSYTVDSAQASGAVDRLVVSTDHAEIAAVAKQAGAEVLMRPPELSTDQARTEAALLHVLDTLEKSGFRPDLVLTLEPTSPFRSAELIRRCLKIFEATDADSVIGVVESRENYGRIVDGRYQFLFPDQPRRRQEREPLYREASTIYATRTATLRNKQSVLGDRLHALVVEESEAVDINTVFDFNVAEALMQLNAAEKKVGNI
jgi:N-acylneuraminate cytidylyltransferase